MIFFSIVRNFGDGNFNKKQTQKLNFIIFAKHEKLLMKMQQHQKIADTYETPLQEQNFL